MGKGIGCIYKHSQRNWPYLSLNTTFAIPQSSEPSKQTQITSAYDTSVGASDLSSPVLDQNTRNHVNIDVKNNDDL